MPDKTPQAIAATILRILRPLSDEDARRVLKSVTVLYDLERGT